MGKATKSFGGFFQNSVLDPMRGKVNIPDQYKVDKTAYENTASQTANQERLRKQALGEDMGNTTAQLQLKRGTDRNISQIVGNVNAQRNNQSLALREGLRAQAGAGQTAAGDSAMLRAQEMQSAQEAYAQDLNRQQIALQNRESTKAGISSQTQQLQAGANLNQQQQTKKEFTRGMDMANSMMKGSGSSGGGMAAMGGSDENIKKNVKNVSSKDLEDFAEKLNAKKFNYKQPNGELYQNGEVTGIMAQDLEKSKIGKTMVVESDEGKMVDFKRAVPVTMAAISDIMKRIKKIEKSKE